ncbi:hypothetical protein B0H11DRAFT_1940271 [Mycena galericulata]|nr:hypothetical protein B0H11DRAFT_1940271 [Mycena galericulata]
MSMFENCSNFTILGGTFNAGFPSSRPPESDFRSIPLGDLNLLSEVGRADIIEYRRDVRRSTEDGRADTAGAGGCNGGRKWIECVRGAVSHIMNISQYLKSFKGVLPVEKIRYTDTSAYQRQCRDLNAAAAYWNTQTGVHVWLYDSDSPDYSLYCMDPHVHRPSLRRRRRHVPRANTTHPSPRPLHSPPPSHPAFSSPSALLRSKTALLAEMALDDIVLRHVSGMRRLPLDRRRRACLAHSGRPNQIRLWLRVLFREVYVAACSRIRWDARMSSHTGRSGCITTPRPDVNINMDLDVRPYSVTAGRGALMIPVLQGQSPD